MMSSDRLFIEWLELWPWASAISCFVGDRKYKVNILLIYQSRLRF
jgi:hypothetical protein